MFNIDFTFAWAAFNLAVIYFVVNKFLFKRLGVYMEKRSDGIAADIRRGESLLAESEQSRAQYESLLKETSEKQRALIEEARVSAEKEYARIVNDAKKEASRIKAEARGDIEREREQMKREIAGDVVSLAITAASRVVEANMDSERNSDLVEQFLSEMSEEGVA